ncbi:MAG: hypothetical protein ACYCZX_01350 [Rhodospirillaceae bacterium]
MRRRLWTLSAAAFTGTAVTAFVAHTAAPTVLTGKDALGDWSTDKPGVTRHISASEIPKPNQPESARNSPQVDDRPAGAKLSVPAGFAVT